MSPRRGALDGLDPHAAGELAHAVKVLEKLRGDFPELAEQLADGREKWEHGLDAVLGTGHDVTTRSERDSEPHEERMKKDFQIVVRMPSELAEKIDAYAERLESETPGLNVSRSDAARMLIVMGLDVAAKKRSK